MGGQGEENCAGCGGRVGSEELGASKGKAAFPKTLTRKGLRERQYTS